MKNKILAIIVVYNDYKNAVSCLKSLLKTAKKDFELQIMVIDNSTLLPGEKDNFKDSIKNFAGVSLIQNQKNIGFGRANNIGIKYGLEEKFNYILLTNPDTAFDEDKNFLSSLFDFIKNHKQVGIVGPCIKHEVNGRLFYDYGGQVNLLTARAKHINKSKRISKGYRIADFVSGACMLIDCSVLKKAGMFDERYFLYLEDVDLCLKFKNIGYKIANLYSASISHIGGTSGNDAGKLFYSLVSSFIFVWKWTPLIFKPFGWLYNSLFYPYLGITWSLKRLKKRLVKD